MHCSLEIHFRFTHVGYLSASRLKLPNSKNVLLISVLLVEIVVLIFHNLFAMVLFYLNRVNSFHSSWDGAVFCICTGKYW